MKKLLPPRDMAWFNPATGRPTDIFFEYIRSLESRSLGQPVSTTAPSNGQFMVYSATSDTWSLQPTVAQTDTQVLIWDATAGVWEAGTN